MNIHMIGIGGIGMSALAQLYAHLGHRVTGSDRDIGPTTDLLVKKGIQVVSPQRVENVPIDLALVVYSDAVPADHVERVRARELGVREISYFAALGEVSKSKRTIAIAGTNGKTTTTGLLAKILIDAGKSPTVIVGSILKDFGSNFVAGDSDWVVIEACEYRDHLLELSPEVLVITNVEWDHTDWFKSEEDMIKTFNQAARAVPVSGSIIVDSAGPHMGSVLQGVKAKVIAYSDIVVPQLLLLGDFNRQNARAAVAVAQQIFPDISTEIIHQSVATFQGTWRRFEYKGEHNGALIYDDYAHHPTAIRETILAMREKFPNKKIVLVFHPHLYSRTHDLFDGFVEALALADRIILAPIYPAREIDTGVVSSDMLREAIRLKHTDVTLLLTFDDIVEKLCHTVTNEDVVVTMGAGDVYKVADALVGSGAE